MEIWNTRLIKEITGQFKLPLRSVHGPSHWKRVHRNGLELANITGASTRVVELFALFHDSCRESDHQDPNHGPRAAAFAEKCFQGSFFECADEEIELLLAACYGHTHGKTHPDITIATCWDADRLDLPRVGISPIPNRLCTNAARSSAIIEDARDRAEKWLSKIYPVYHP